MRAGKHKTFVGSGACLGSKWRQFGFLFASRGLFLRLASEGESIREREREREREGQREEEREREKERGKEREGENERERNGFVCGWFLRLQINAKYS